MMHPDYRFQVENSRATEPPPEDRARFRFPENTSHLSAHQLRVLSREPERRRPHPKVDIQMEISRENWSVLPPWAVCEPLPPMTEAEAHAAQLALQAAREAQARAAAEARPIIFPRGFRTVFAVKQARARAVSAAKQTIARAQTSSRATRTTPKTVAEAFSAAQEALLAAKQARARAQKAQEPMVDEEFEEGLEEELDDEFGEEDFF